MKTHTHAAPLMREAAELFREYERHHEAKARGSIHADDRLAKAARNRVIAEKLEAWLAEHELSSKPSASATDAWGAPIAVDGPRPGAGDDATKLRARAERAEAIVHALIREDNPLPDVRACFSFLLGRRPAKEMPSVFQLFPESECFAEAARS